MKVKRELENFGLTYLEINGFFNGVPEASFMVFHTNSKVDQLIRGLAQDCNQSSLLHIDSNNQAWLESLKGDLPLELGRWKEVSKEEAATKKAYSVILGRYFLAE